MNKRIVWHIEKRKVKDLKPYEKNPRIITEIGLDHLKKSFDEIGFAQPININLDNTILSGHARVQQLLKENVLEVDCYVPDRQLTPKQEEAVIIRMNKNVAGEWDFKMLREDFDFGDLEDYGFSETELEDIKTVDEADLPDLKEGDADDFTQKTFTLHVEQAETVDRAVDLVLKEYKKVIETELNPNKNGNAIKFICENFLHNIEKK